MNDKLITYLLNEREQYKNIPIPTDDNERFRLYRSLVNIRSAAPISEDYLSAEDEYLQALTAKKGISWVIVISQFAVVPLYYLCFGLWKQNYPLVLTAALFFAIHTINGYMNFIAKK